MRALIVDDSRAMRLVIGRIMTDLGFEIADAANGREALDRLAAGPAPTVALVDWNMPEMNGLELVCALRANDRYSATRIVMAMCAAWSSAPKPVRTTPGRSTVAVTPVPSRRRASS